MTRCLETGSGGIFPFRGRGATWIAGFQHTRMRSELANSVPIALIKPCGWIYLSAKWPNNPYPVLLEKLRQITATGTERRLIVHVSNTIR